MMTEMDIETSVYNVHLTRLIAREDFIKFTRRESTKTHIEKTNVSKTISVLKCKNMLITTSISPHPSNGVYL
jgi:hypothetical protein